MDDEPKKTKSAWVDPDEIPDTSTPEWEPAFAKAKFTRGRPATGKDPLIAFRSPVELTAAIDAYVEKQEPPKPSRSEAIRRLIEKALSEDGL